MNKLNQTKSLRFKSIVILTFAHILLFAIVFFTVVFFVNRSVNDLESYYARENAFLVERVLISSSDSLSNTVQDWAIWDETYHYMDGSYPDYESSNLTYDSFATLNINLVIFYDTNQNIVYASFFDFEAETEMVVDVSLLSKFEALGIPQNISKDHTPSGILTTDLGVYYIASSPIIKHSEDSLVIGNLIFAKLINQASIEALGTVLGFPFEIKENTSLNLENKISVEQVNSKQILVNYMIDDLLSRNDYMIQVLSDKNVASAVSQTPAQFIISLSLVAVIYALFTLTYLDKDIFKRLKRLNNEILHLSNDVDSLAQVYVSPNKDEIESIGHEINHLLVTIHKSKQKIIEMSYEDYLTKIPNKKWFDNHLDQSIELANQNQSKFAVLFIDIDGFKHINDMGGHDAGDQFLIKASRIFQSTLDNGESIARIGGDEFLIVKNYETLEEVNKLSLKLLKSLDESELMNTAKLHITLSIGIALYPENGLNRNDLVKKADAALYKSKSEGKNRVYYFSDIK